ncbi:hypothetical protein [Metabacillus arenae]|uniref:Uncharacterized protein n=1 Tax=Metabacillus arenae TaxID=2771434 RepID=A0A926N841_9BACI|nr:hypothetical protein [Metabacillus arenae]MBD1379147.1 hypothetical protein [Metabacillus arenae]
MFSIVIRFKDKNWIDLDGVPDTILIEALNIWSSAKEESIKINGMTFDVAQIRDIVISK